MQSKMLLGALSALFAMTLLFTLAVPRRPPAAGDDPSQGPVAVLPAAGGSGEAVPVEVGRAPPPELVDGIWQPAGYGVHLPAPEGWIASRRRSRAYLHADPSQPLAGNFSLITLPNLFGLTMEQLLEENRTELEGNPQFDLIDIALVEVAGAPRIRADYVGTPRGRGRVHFRGLIWLDGSQQIVLTFTVDEDLYEQLGPVAERCLEGVSITSMSGSARKPAN